MKSPVRAAVYTIIGVSHLGLALTVTVNIVLLSFLQVFLLRHEHYSAPALSSAAWAILIVTVLAAEILTVKRTEPLPNWSFWAYLATLAVVVALDVAGAWGASVRFAYPTAAAATGAALSGRRTVSPDQGHPRADRASRCHPCGCPRQFGTNRHPHAGS